MSKQSEREREWTRWKKERNGRLWTEISILEMIVLAITMPGNSMCLDFDYHAAIFGFIKQFHTKPFH